MRHTFRPLLNEVKIDIYENLYSKQLGKYKCISLVNHKIIFLQSVYDINLSSRLLIVLHSGNMGFYNDFY